jgi:O-antigen/teichoic acid export membrane protein
VNQQKLLQSGIIFSAASFLTNLGNFAFLALIGRQLAHNGEFSLANNAMGFAQFLALPLAIATAAVTHYIARFHFSDDDARLQGLLAGCRKFLLSITIAGSIIALILFKPLSDFFHFPRTSLMLAALAVVLASLWGAFATALCQGLAWFKRLALIAFLVMCLRLMFCGATVWKFPVAETAVLAYVAAMLANLILLFWRKDLARPASPISPWDREFIKFLISSAACVGSINLFQQGDMLVAQRYFTEADRDAYIAAERLAVALPVAVAPLLMVLFTHRSSEHHGAALREQLKLLGLYAAGLVCGAVCLFALRIFCLKLLGRNTPEAAAMMGPLAITMVFVGLLQALALWALASRWLKMSLFYGALGVAYWLTLLFLGKSPADLLRMMPVAAGLAFVALFLVWFVTLRLHKIGAPEQS